MELIDYLRMLGRRWRWVAALTLLGLAGGVAYVLTAPKVYEATAEMFVGSVVGDGGSGTSAAAQSASQFTLDRMQSYSALVDSPVVAQGVAEQLARPIDNRDFASEVSATVPDDTVLLRVSVTDGDPQVAADLANATAIRLGDTIEMLEASAAGRESPVNVTVTGPATASNAPTSPNRPVGLALGVVVGLGLGLLTASVRDQAARTPSSVHRRRDAPSQREAGLGADRRHVDEHDRGNQAQPNQQEQPQLNEPRPDLVPGLAGAPVGPSGATGASRP